MGAALAEGDVVVVAARDVEVVGVAEDLLVAVAGGEPHHHLVALLHALAAQLAIARGGAAEVVVVEVLRGERDFVAGCGVDQAGDQVGTVAAAALPSSSRIEARFLIWSSSTSSRLTNFVDVKVSASRSTRTMSSCRGNGQKPESGASSGCRCTGHRHRLEPHSRGITSSTDPGLGPGGAGSLFGGLGTDNWIAHADLAASGELQVRVSVPLLPAPMGGCADDVRKGLAELRRPESADPRLLRAIGVKVFADGPGRRPVRPGPAAAGPRPARDHPGAGGSHGLRRVGRLRTVRPAAQAARTTVRRAPHRRFRYRPATRHTA